MASKRRERGRHRRRFPRSSLHRGGRRHLRRANGARRRHRPVCQRPCGDHRSQIGCDPRRVPRSVCRFQPGRLVARPGDHGTCGRGDSPHHPGTGHGRVVLASQHRRLRRGAPGRERVAEDAPDDGHRGWDDPPVTGPDSRCRCRRSPGHRHCQAARCRSPRLRHPPGDRRAGRESRCQVRRRSDPGDG